MISSPFIVAMALQTCSVSTGEGTPQHFVYFGRDHRPATERTFLEQVGVDGAQLTFTWRELEPERDRYDFGEVDRHLELLGASGKSLWIQLADVTFSERLPVPDYLVTDGSFNGGVARKYEGSAGVFDGWVARRWDPVVRERFTELIRALATEFDGRIAGLNLVETAIGFEDPRFHPPGFSYEGYAAGLRETMRTLRGAFAESCVILYANFMPGESLPESDNGYLKGLYELAARIDMGVGGPDLLPFREGQQRNSLPLIAARERRVIAGMAVQDGNLEEVDPDTGRPVTVERLYRFAREQLGLEFIFWGREEPYYSTVVLPFLVSLSN